MVWTSGNFNEYTVSSIPCKVKLSLRLNKYHSVKTYILPNSASHHEGVWGRRGIASCIISLGTKWKWTVSVTPRPLEPWIRAQGTHYIEGWLGPRAGWDAVSERCPVLLPGIELRSSSPASFICSHISLTDIRNFNMYSYSLFILFRCHCMSAEVQAVTAKLIKGTNLTCPVEVQFKQAAESVTVTVQIQLKV
jgi:hypothetical protein